MTRGGGTLALPWTDRDDAHCFGCSPANPAGLALRFRPDGEALVTDLHLDHRYESYPGVVHGGIVALVCDELLGNLVVLRGGGPAVTTSLRVRYVGAVEVGRRYVCRGTLAGRRDPLGPTTGHAEIRDAADALVATATAAYHPVPADASGRPLPRRNQ